MKTAIIGAILVCALMYTSAGAAADCSCDTPPQCTCEAACDCGKDACSHGVPMECCPREEYTICCEREEFRLLCKPCKAEKPPKCECVDKPRKKCTTCTSTDDWGFE